MDIREIVNQLCSEASDRQISRDMQIDRRTVKRYREWAQEQGLLKGDLPALETIQELAAKTLKIPAPPQIVSSVEPYREIVEKLVWAEVESTTIHERLKERGYTGSYSSVYRFVRTIKPRMPDVTVRVERKPGEEAQVDFGYAGRMIDPESSKLRKAWAFVMTLSWSRHQYVEFAWDQKVETWLRLHRNAFEFFGGVPGRVVPDNLKAAIVRACWDDPQVQYSYRECAQHYGFRIAPCRSKTPQHKGKVEQGGVHYVQRNFLGGRDATKITQANRDVLVWCNTTAGNRIHGTTKEKPLERFDQVEKTCLKPLPETPYDLIIWKKVKVYRDCYVSFEGAYYSVPFRLVSQKLWLCAGSKQVRLFDQAYELKATHTRAQKPGQRQTNPKHLPPEKLPGLFLNRETCLEEAHSIGSAAFQVVQTLLDDPVVDRLPTAGRLLRLGKKFGEERLEAACCRALAHDDPNYKTIKRILIQKLEKQSQQSAVILPPATTFARSCEELVGALVEVGSWS